MNFWKMHGLSNDYIVVDNRDSKIIDQAVSAFAKRLCARRSSVGADGLLLLSTSSIADVKMRIFNADGSESAMCGNGIRCFCKYCFEKKIIAKKEFLVETKAGLRQTWLTVENQVVKNVRVDMGKPFLDRSKIPMLGQGKCIDQDLDLNGEKFKITCLSVGNPHCVIFLENIAGFPVQEVGPKIGNHSLFPNRINVVFSQILGENELKVRVWEKGVGETLACGTGACAAVVAGNLLKKISRKVEVHMLGGNLKIEYPGSLFMSGPAEKVFEGRLL